VLRSIAHHFYITSNHMRQLIGYFRTPQQRADVFVVFYLRIVDMHNAKLFRVRFEKQEEVWRLRNRLGYASFFPFMQPENSSFELDLSCHDQRLCASMYVALALREKASNIRKPEWVLADGRINPAPWVSGVPRSWEDADKIEPHGIFRGTYVCAPEDRCFELRCKLAATNGHFVAEFEEKDVRWWTGLTEPPADVMEFLEFLISHVGSTKEAFDLVDSANGTAGNGFITLRELENGIVKMGCKKFRGKHEKERISNVFRYLDMGMEGTISLKEWQLLDQLWQEFDLSIREFVHFLTLAYGEELNEGGNSDNSAWAKMDTDSSGGLSQEEWRQAVENIGYFGPSRVVFALLDKDDDGVISFSEYEVLERYRSKR